MTDNHKLPIRLVCATRLPADKFISHTATGRSVKSFIGVSAAEVRLFSENTVGLSVLYNLAIEESIKEPAILVFIHDDVLISDFFWEERIRDGLNQFDIIGLAGTTRRVKNQASWVFLDTNGTCADKTDFSGVVGHGSNFPPDIIDNYGPPNQECKLLDGLFLGVKSEVLHQTGLRFDERFKFHMYDADFCRSAELLNLSMGTISLSVVHESLASFSSIEFKEAYKEYMQKWNE